MGHCWKGITTLLLSLMGKDNDMMLEVDRIQRLLMEGLDPDVVEGRIRSMLLLLMIVPIDVVDGRLEGRRDVVVDCSD